ncbi:hypothetical protein C1I97_09375 [Streptomyces sp. NTH33]|uniref:hypothetical protein n=1 Tax=Streptomyces sp. NTH33 TaxID=1735453 RepID=UPI000DA81FE7|nr:hypothetical protein [Streptomyces sp. NTH33]PZH14938.1 hypothetical protein C1I97_09375 [Streptomyces sp. NTH33]
MRKFQKAAVVVAMLGSVSFLGAGVSHADGDDAKFRLDNKQNQSCSADESDMTGFSLLGRNHIPVNILGLQHNDHSKRTSVTCNQLFTIGR